MWKTTSYGTQHLHLVVFNSPMHFLKKRGKPACLLPDQCISRMRSPCCCMNQAADKHLPFSQLHTSCISGGKLVWPKDKLQFEISSNNWSTDKEKNKLSFVVFLSTHLYSPARTVMSASSLNLNYDFQNGLSVLFQQIFVYILLHNSKSKIIPYEEVCLLLNMDQLNSPG